MRLIEENEINDGVFILVRDKIFNNHFAFVLAESTLHKGTIFTFTGSILYSTVNIGWGYQRLAYLPSRNDYYLLSKEDIIEI